MLIHHVIWTKKKNSVGKKKKKKMPLLHHHPSDPEDHLSSDPSTWLMLTRQYVPTINAALFLSMFGVHMTVFCLAYEQLMSQVIPPPHGFNPVHVLWMMHWLKAYTPTVYVVFKVSEKTFRLHVMSTLNWFYVGLSNVTADDRLVPNGLQGVWARITSVIDTTFCPINKPTNNEVQRVYYSGKHKGHGVKYECCVRMNDGLFVWSTGAVPGSVHDSQIARNAGVMDELVCHPNELIAGDKAYEGIPHFISPVKGKNLSPQEAEFNEILSTHRIVVERAFGRVKNYKCFSSKWRHDLALHPIAFDVVLNLTNFDIRVNPRTDDDLE
eukprot:Lithocolla_globosa_v1_NODE_557_length_3753_cov_135.321796.p1 type:complete len:325 gc:universal NODE_557_length_3753_cov_135.321796:1312-338(-)